MNYCNEFSIIIKVKGLTNFIYHRQFSIIANKRSKKWFEGIIILTTNLDKSIDKAFQRRIQFKVTFPFPEAEYRAAIWELLFPKECPVSDDMDWELVEIGRAHV